jgi:hypothetical protein
MAKIEEIRSYPNKSANQYFEAACRAYPKAGFELWKKREIAWLAIARIMQEGKQIDSNASARPGNPPILTVNISAEHLSEEALRPLMENFLNAMSEELK